MMQGNFGSLAGHEDQVFSVRMPSIAWKVSRRAFTQRHFGRPRTDPPDCDLSSDEDSALASDASSVLALTGPRA